MVERTTNITVVPQPSDEASEEQLRLARAQGETFGSALEHMTQRVAHGEERAAGDYLVGYAIEHAEGMYHQQDGELVWQDPQQENAHVEIVVRDAADGRFLPNLTVYATLIDAHGREVGTHKQPFLWHPWIFHYGCNWHVPGDGTYTLRVRIEPATFMSHDKKNGQRFAKMVEVEFANVRIETGQKHS